MGKGDLLSKSILIAKIRRSQIVFFLIDINYKRFA
jgi:hypothetical protein